MLFYIGLVILLLLLWGLMSAHQKLSVGIDFYGSFLAMAHPKHEWHSHRRLCIWLRWITRLGIVAIAVGLLALLRTYLWH
jgi:hypothetical protein